MDEVDSVEGIPEPTQSAAQALPPEGQHAGGGRKPKGLTSKGRFGILNPWGTIWTPETFDTRQAASTYVERYWADFGPGARDPKDFEVVPVSVRVTPDRTA